MAIIPFAFTAQRGFFMARNWKECIKTVGALCVAACVGLAVLMGYRGKLSAVSVNGARTYYLYSASSQAETKGKIELGEIFCVSGESVAFVSVESLDEKRTRALAALKERGVTVLFEEEINGVLSVYGYSPALYEPVLIKGEQVNLHIAISDTRTVVGSPIVFGGY